MTTTGRLPNQPQQHQTPTEHRPLGDRSASAIARIEAMLAEASQPLIILVECIGPNCEREVFPWLDPACSPRCAREARKRGGIRGLDAHFVIVDEIVNSVRVADEREPSTLDGQDQAVLDVLVRDAPAYIRDLHRAGHLGYFAAADEWVDHHGAPLIEPLQHAADALARSGELPEFAEWFPAEPRPANEPQPLVEANRYGGTVGSLIGVPIPECPPRPTEPPVAHRSKFGTAFIALFNALPEVIALFRKWVRRG